jgi:hypothetical protein
MRNTRKASKSKWGNLYKHNPRHPVANCCVYIINGPSWRKYKGGPYFFRDALATAIGVAKGVSNINVRVVVQRKRKILWASDGKIF